MATLTGTTVVRHPDTLAAMQLRKGDTLPEWAVGLVGDHLLDAPAKPARHAAPREPGQEPPRGGAGSGAAEWAAYARTLGVEPASETSRDAIIEQLTQLNLVKPTS